MKKQFQLKVRLIFGLFGGVAREDGNFAEVFCDFIWFFINILAFYFD